ncbi:MAG: phosphate acetyltransferase [Candidatus Dactylopiibacterium carminicum]|uniref:Phosphate acetyltransferase n=1 Tax=Candidatus Dactylopiibacterium carminicum TaxID=857335 RepID=A0ABQ7HSK2_9RHOO|nr:phosphate acetyltransferase [Candidatus Dactylopiibacterium carminicum]KAF7600148.1 phosphate acetyltransferase [Candidatus Dactylopiibacterium carminicum]PAS98213.1 MAG: phosphate acetyltransferase [Candidatus Dactylopiibacterium carminicum]PAT00147.1 MAG: phosphate acetyltransferase [Candidatus Dactylopiibacterium carminicum]
MQTFFLAPTRQNVGLTSVALGVVRALQRQGLRVGFAKPVTQDDTATERSVHFAREICQVSAPNALTTAQVVARISAGQIDELLEDIVSLCMGAAENVDVLVIEGLHTDPSFSFTTRLNADIARSLQAKMVLVASAQDAGVTGEVKLTASQFRAAGCKVAGTIFNKVAADFDATAAAAALDKLPLWGVIRNNPALLAPRTLDVARHLNADVVVEGEIAQRRVLETVVAARSAAEMINRLNPCALVVSAGDRDDVMLATALAASRGVQLAGLLLTHDSGIDPRIMELSAKALDNGLPILRVKGDTFSTAAAISRISPAVAADDTERMGQVLDSVAEALNAEALLASVKMPSSTRMSPPAFRYQLIQKARSANKRIVLPEGDEPRTIKAAVICEEKGIARCVLLGKPDAIKAVAAAQGVTLPDSLEILDPDSIREQYVPPMVELRKSKGLTEGQARDQLQDTVVLGTMMLAQNDVDGLVSGAVHTTASTVRPALQLIKTAPGNSIVSSVFFMLMPDQVLVYGDCAINPDPNAQELAEIALQSAASAQAFGIDPKVAMISYSTGTSGQGADVEKVKEATAIAKEKAPELALDGPLQYDAASVADVARSKAPNSQVAGQATVFVFPDLNTGNTTYKAVQRSANVVSVGPMLQGLRKPVNDLSRGALVDDIVFTIALTAIQADAPAK